MVKLVACQVKSPNFHNNKPNTYNSLSRDFPDRGGSRGRVQGVGTPSPLPEMTCGFLIQLVFCKKKKTTWFIGVEVEQETSAPSPKNACTKEK